MFRLLMISTPTLTLPLNGEGIIFTPSPFKGEGGDGGKKRNHPECNGLDSTPSTTALGVVLTPASMQSTLILGSGFLLRSTACIHADVPLPGGGDSFLNRH